MNKSELEGMVKASGKLNTRSPVTNIKEVSAMLFAAVLLGINTPKVVNANG